jgi:ADP-ribose pyrophosphatase
MSCQPVNDESIHRGEYLEYKLYHYTDPNGVYRCWEGVERTTRKGDLDAIDIIAINKDNEYLLVKQYRPPTKSYVIEFPSGLVEEGESASDAALRELHEETGSIGEVKLVGPMICYEPGISNGNTQVVHVQITEQKEQKLDAGEFIEILKIKPEYLYEFLLNEKKNGVNIDSRVYYFALGTHFNKINQ